MIRVVLDTNIIVSALLQPLGPPAQVLLMAVDGSIQLCVSASVFAEYEEVIRRPRLRRKPLGRKLPRGGQLPRSGGISMAPKLMRTSG